MIDSKTPTDLQAQAQDLVQPILALFAEAKSFDEVREALILQYPRMNTDALTEQIARAKFVADVWGRLNGNR
jgi:phage gp29-like protein